MKTFRTITIVSYLALPLVSSSLFIPLETVAIPRQSSLSTIGKTTKAPVLLTKSEVRNSAKNSVLVRNTATTEPGPKTTTTASTPKNENKQTIGRCWKRLMNMVREVNHAHRNKTTRA